MKQPVFFHLGSPIKVIRYLDEFVAECPCCSGDAQSVYIYPDFENPTSLRFKCLGCSLTFECFSFTDQPSPTDQDCTLDGGVSANRIDDNSTGGVTTPEVTWRASGSHSREEIA